MAGFREHRERLALQKAQAHALQTGQPVKTNASADAMHVVLANEVNKIKAMPQRSERNEYKRLQFLPKFLPLVEEYFNKGAHYQNDVIGYCLIYLFDIGDFEQALTLASRAIADRQRLPEGFSRTIEHFATDSILTWAEIQSAHSQSVEPYFSQVLENIITKWGVHDIVFAKYLKLTAQMLLKPRDNKNSVMPSLVNEPERLTLAIFLAGMAYEHHHKIGVKSMVERCEMRLNALKNVGIVPAQNESHPQSGADKGEKLKAHLPTIRHLLQSPALTLEEVAEKIRERQAETLGEANV